MAGVIALFATITTAFAADFKIIAYKTVSATALTKAELQSIFLGEKSRWEDGKPIKIVVLEDGPVHKEFLQAVLGKTPSQFDSYWKKLVFTGKAAAPKSFAEVAELVDYIGTHPGTIGYVAAGQRVGSIKTISIK